jgi:hypothetical protein
VHQVGNQTRLYYDAQSTNHHDLGCCAITMYWSTWHNIPEGLNLNQHCCENHISCCVTLPDRLSEFLNIQSFLKELLWLSLMLFCIVCLNIFELIIWISVRQIYVLYYSMRLNSISWLSLMQEPPVLKLSHLFSNSFIGQIFLRQQQSLVRFWQSVWLLAVNVHKHHKH